MIERERRRRKGKGREGRSQNDRTEMVKMRARVDERFMNNGSIVDDFLDRDDGVHDLVGVSLLLNDRLEEGKDGYDQR